MPRRDRRPGPAGYFFFSSRRRHTRWTGDWSSDVCSSDLDAIRLRVENLLAQADGVGGIFEGAVAQIGRASCRERVEMPVVAVCLKKKDIESALQCEQQPQSFSPRTVRALVRAQTGFVLHV